MRVAGVILWYVACSGGEISVMPHYQEGRSLEVQISF